MKKLTLSIEEFKLKEFLEETLNEGKAFISVPVFLVDNIEKFDFDTCFDEYEETNVEELHEDFTSGKYLFAAFSDCGVNYPDVACIDGEVYQTIERSEVEEYFDEEGAPADFVFTDKLYLGEISSLGYLLKIHDNQVTIQSAQFYVDAMGTGGPVATYSRIEIREDVEVFEEPMQEYINKFIQK
jgi:hypothetical protein